jgi:glycosyltransferase involved in cell wall biosynthesis
MTYLDKVLDCIKKQTRKPDKLIVIYDGVDSQFIQVRNKVIEMDMEKLVLVSDNRSPVFTISERRRNIARNHNIIRETMTECDWVWSIEDDGIIPDDALEKLVKFVEEHPNVGVVSGAELGRWGKPYVGAWRVDDPNQPKEICSLENKSAEGGIETIDGAGLYCSLIRYEGYKNHNFYSHNGLGPDVNLGLYLRTLGYDNYIDWSIHVTHITHFMGEEIEIPATAKSSVVKFILLSGSTWKY